MGSKHTGAYGERIAAEYLLGKGYSLLATNWRCTHGELDIVAQDNEMLVFVEVKTRHVSDPADAFLSVTPRKRQRLIASAYSYIDSQTLDNPVWRVDVVGIALPGSGQPLIVHMEDALDW
jgi:putative endonuclease